MRTFADDTIARPKSRLVESGEVERAVSVQGMAFSADPCMRALWPEPGDYLRHFPDLVDGFEGIREIRVGNFPPVIPMLRLPR